MAVTVPHKKLLIYYTIIIITIFSCINLYYLTQKPHVTAQTDHQAYNTLYNTQKKLVIHISREHGVIAPYGGLASVVDSLSRFQVESEEMDSWVIMPKYSFIQDVDKVTELQFRYKDKMISTTVYKKIVHKVLVLLIGNSESEPFDNVFECSEKQLYITPPSITSSARESYISVAAANLILQITYGQLTYFKSSVGRKVDYVHIHGSTNGLVAPLLHQYMGIRLRPTIIYTLHDYNSEAWSVVSQTDLKSFGIRIDLVVDQKSASASDVIFISKIGIIYSDIVTCVSKNMQQSIISGEINFAFRKELLKKHKDTAFVGIANAVSPSLDRSLNKQLTEIGCNYVEGKSIIEFKMCSKRYLRKNGLIVWDITYPIVLFIGRFEENKGVEYLPFIATLAAVYKFKFVVMGYSEKTSPWRSTIDKLRSNNDVLVIDNLSDQAKYGIFFRAAAEFVFMPSKEEGYGLVAAEGAHFGSIPIASNIGGLRDIVIPYQKNSDKWTGFLFDINDGTKRHMMKTFETAIQLYTKLYDYEKEVLLKRIMVSQLGWRHAQGPVKHYFDAYKHGDELRNQLHHLDGFGDTVQDFFGPNLVKNPSFDPEVYDEKIHQFEHQMVDSSGPSPIYTTMFRLKPNEQPAWVPHFDGYEITANGRSGTGIKCENTDTSDKKGVQQTIVLKQRVAKNVLISAWSKAVDVSGDIDSSYSIYVDVNFVDRTNAWGLHTPFSVGTHGWEQKRLLLSFEKPIQQIVVSLLFKGISRLGV